MSATPHFQPTGPQHRPDFHLGFARECAFISENAEAHALGALRPDEAEMVDRHVSTCPRCAHIVEQSRLVVDFLPFHCALVPAPESAFTGLVARIQNDRPPAQASLLSSLNPWQMDAPVRSWTIPSSKEIYASAPGVAPRARRRKRFVNWDVWAAPLAAMPLVLALAVVGGWAMNTRTSLHQQQSANRVISEQNQQLNAQVLAYNSSALGSNGSTASASAADFSLDSMDANSAPNASGSVTALSSRKLGVEVSNLPSTVKMCEIELETMDGRRIRAGMLRLDSTGSGKGAYNLSQPLTAVRSVHVVPVVGTSAPQGVTDVSAPNDLLMVQINSNLGEPGGTESNPFPR